MSKGTFLLPMWTTEVRLGLALCFMNMNTEGKTKLAATEALTPNSQETFGRLT